MGTARRVILTAGSLVALSGLLLTVAIGSAGATPSKYAFHTGDGFEGIASPDVSAASNGDTVTIRAAGQFHVASHKASGTGTFEHRTAGGELLASGTFTVTSVSSFSSFGCGVAGGEPFPADFCGGYAVLPIHIVAHPASGGTAEFGAVFTITCVVGDHVPTGAEEAVTVDVPGVVNFDRPVSGENLFVQK
jgi:hypothetical protein